MIYIYITNCSNNNRSSSIGSTSTFDLYNYRVIKKKLCTFLKHRHFLQEVRRDLKFLHDLDKCWEGLQKISASYLFHSPRYKEIF